MVGKIWRQTFDGVADLSGGTEQGFLITFTSQVTDITEGIRKALEDMITANTWMDTTTKQLAVDKVYTSQIFLS